MTWMISWVSLNKKVLIMEKINNTKDKLCNGKITKLTIIMSYNNLIQYLHVNYILFSKLFVNWLSLVKRYWILLF